jgi:flagellin
MLHDLNGLLVASSNTGALSDAEIAANQEQVNSLVSSIQRFGGQAVDALGAVGLSDGGEAIGESLSSATAALSFLTSGGAGNLANGDLVAAQAAVSTAATAVSELRGTVGSHQKNTLAPRFNSIQVERENLMSARSRLADTDYAQETSVLARFQTLTKAGIQVLKIANENQGQILDLLA